ncbi:MAG: head GIN domain-containing protein [Bacteroides sp.]|nr:head GIN domain-containing protein [Bacteroides sp.]
MKTSVLKKGSRMASLILIAILFVSATLMACENAVRGSGVVVREVRETPSFTGVSVSSAIKLVVTQDEAYEVVVSADDNLLPYILTEVSGNSLRIGVEPFTSLRGYKEITVYVTAPLFEKISCSGAAEVEGTGLLSQESLQIKCSGAGNVNLQVESSYLEVDGSGASDIRLEGTTRSLQATVSGASDMKSFGLECLMAEVGLSGASDLQITVSENVTGKASGASSLNVRGGASVDVRTSGASSVASR